MRILIVEDTEVLARQMATYVSRATGYGVDLAATGHEALSMFDPPEHLIVIVDWGLPGPGPDGKAVGMTFRDRAPSVGIVFTTARDAVDDRVEALAACADDYLVKPYDPRELVARIKTLARRLPSRAPHADQSGTRLHWGGLSIDPCTHTVDVLGKGAVELTTHEFLLLVCLVRNAGRVATERELRAVLRSATDPDGSGIRTKISGLRRKLGAAGRCIVAHRGAGYALRIPVGGLVKEN